MKQPIGRLFILLALAALINTPSVSGQNTLRTEMNKVFKAFKDLQPYLLSEKRFQDPANVDSINNILIALNFKFHDVESFDNKFNNEPGFVSTLKILDDMLTDARYRFKEGNKGYALWRLRTVSNYCVSCHARHDIKTDFYAGEIELKGATDLERGEFYLASRQFEKAKEAFFLAATDPRNLVDRLDALRKWMIIYVRIHPDPQGAITALQKLRAKANFNFVENESIRGWLDSLLRWQNESKSKVEDVRKAENLISQASALNDPLSGYNGDVELLRATAILHKSLEQGGKGIDRSRALYLLGLAYNELPFFFANELPTMFLDQCIRDYPATDNARRAYKLFEEITTLGFTGSGGTDMPDDVRLMLKDLRDMAYGTKAVSGRV